MRPAVYFANCLYKSGQTSGIQDTDRHGHRAKKRADGDIVVDELQLRLHRQTSPSELTPFRISSSTIEKTPHQQAIVMILPLMTS